MIANLTHYSGSGFKTAHYRNLPSSSGLETSHFFFVFSRFVKVLTIVCSALVGCRYSVAMGSDVGSCDRTVNPVPEGKISLISTAIHSQVIQVTRGRKRQPTRSTICLHLFQNVLSSKYRYRYHLQVRVVTSRQ